MEVSGKKLMKDKGAKLCSFCDDFDITTCADGFCVECEVYFCNSCFVKHKGRKISRNHSLVKIDDSNSVKITVDDTYDTCQQHKGEFVKFYCPKHDQVGCGECGVLNHNGCKLEFIRDKVAAFNTSRDSINIIEEIARCKKEVEESVSLLVINRQQLADFYEQFVRDVEAFADRVIERIQIMKTSVLNQAKEAMLNDKKKMDELQNQTDDLIAELSRQSNMLKSKNNQPNKFFVASLQVKSQLKQTKKNVDFLKQKNIVTQYKFQRDEELAALFETNNVIGSLIEQSEKIQQHQHEFRQTNAADNWQVQDPLPQHAQSDRRIMQTVRQYQHEFRQTNADDNWQVQDHLRQHAQSDRRIMQTVQQHQHEFRQTNAADNWQVQDPLPQHVHRRIRPTVQQYQHEFRQTNAVDNWQVQDPLPQPLLDRKLVCKNLNIDGECVSYAAYGNNAIGLYVFKENVRHRTFFEIEILGMGKRGSLAVGAVPDNYPDNLLPGVGEHSCGYHSDGKLFSGSTSGEKNGDGWKVGDRIKVYVFSGWTVCFTLNGTHVGGSTLNLTKKHHFAVGMTSPGDRINVVEIPAK